jgi:hypothetical protein
VITPSSLGRRAVLTFVSHTKGIKKIECF